MVHKLSVASANITRIMGRQPEILKLLSPRFQVPVSFWNRLKVLPSLNDASRAQQVPLLFSLARTPQEKAVAGSLMLECGLKLDLEKEKDLVLSLIKCGLAPQALKIWRERKLGGKVDESVFRDFLIVINCRSHRVRDAEALIEGMVPSSAVCLEFVKAYAELRDAVGVDRWITSLVDSRAPALVYKACLRALVKSKSWQPVQRVMKEMTAQGQVVPSDIAATCILAAKRDATMESVASILSWDGAIMNSPLMRLAVGNDPRRELSSMLRRGDRNKALEIIKGYNGPHLLSLCYKFLQSQRRLASIDVARFRECMGPICDRVEDSPIKNGRFVQFMLSYHHACRDYDKLWQFISTYELASLVPLILPLSSSNYEALWRAVLSASKENKTGNMPFTTGTLLVTTLSKVPLTQRLALLIAMALHRVGDLQSLITLLEFAGEKAGLELDGAIIQKLVPNETLTDKHWRTVAAKLCETSSRSLDEIQLAAKPLREQLNMHA